MRCFLNSLFYGQENVDSIYSHYFNGFSKGLIASGDNYPCHVEMKFKRRIVKNVVSIITLSTTVI